VTGALSGDWSRAEERPSLRLSGGPAGGALRGATSANERTDRAGWRVAQANPLVRRGAYPVRPRPSEGRQLDRALRGGREDESDGRRMRPFRGLLASI